MNIVQNLSELPNLTNVDRLVFDTETSGVHPYHGDKICGLVIGPYESDLDFYIPLKHKSTGMLDPYKNLPADQVFRWFSELTRDSRKTWTGHNLKYDLQVLWTEELDLAGTLDDTMILCHVAYGDEWDYALDKMVKRWCGYTHSEAKRLEDYIDETQVRITTDEGKTPPNYSLIPIERIAPYACEDNRTARMLSKFLRARPELNGERIRNQDNLAWGTKELLVNEMKLIRVLADIERNGVKIDIQRCIELRDDANEEIESLNDKMYRLAGKSFPVASAAATAEALEHVGGRVCFWTLPTKEQGKQKRSKYTNVKTASSGRPCFNSEAILDYLKIFRHEKNSKAYDFMLMYYKSEQTRRLVSANLDAYLKGVDRHGRIHAQLHMHRTWTGRLASSNPNLQNIAKVKGTKEQGQIEKFDEHKDEEALNRKIRDLFVAEKGNTLISIDYASIEYRLATYFSCDQKLINMYVQNPDLDFHQITADMMGVDRDVGKTIGFGVLYGMGVRSFADALHLDDSTAKALRNKFFDTRPAFRTLITRIGEWVKKAGGVRNPFGRWCPVPRDLSYKGLNALVQGSAGDLMRYALVKLFELKLPVVPVNDIYDEYLAECSVNNAVEMSREIQRIMGDCPMFLPMPITCSAEFGQSWGRGLKSLEEWSKAA